jgi:diguanylate cyclase (GGDEF)-like protein
MRRLRPDRQRLEQGLVVRLTALVLVPLLLSFWASLTIIGNAREDAAIGRHFEKSVPVADALLQVSRTTLEEMAGAALTVDMRGAPPDLVKAIKDLGLDFDYQKMAVATDKAIAQLAALEPVDPHYVNGLAAARRYLSAPHALGDEVFLRYRAADLNILARLEALPVALSHEGAAKGTGQILQAVNVLKDLGDVEFYRSSQIGNISSFTLPIHRTRTSTVAQLGADNEQFQAASKRLLTAADAATAARWRKILESTSSRHLDDLARAYANVPTQSANPFQVGADLGRSTANLQTSVGILIAQTSQEVLRLSKRVQDNAQSTLRTTAILWLLSSLLVALFGMRVSRTIRRPLRDLAENAHAITDGRLDVHEVSPRGPREIRVVIRAFNELVSNLRLLEAKSLALAGLDLSSPALAAPLPGRLGGAIDASVKALATSVAERDQLGRQLAFDATHDTLTGLPNRAAATNALEQALPRARRTGTAVSVLFIDLDGFKRVNDTHGHQVGDQLLKVVSARMQQVAREGDVLARLGGDEFVIIAEATDPEGAVALGQRIIAALDTPMDLSGLRLAVGTSVGIAVALDANDTAADVLRQADLALYRAKDSGRGRVALFDAHLQSELDERNDVEAALQATLDRGGDELELHYQPVIESGSGRLTGVEALVRWNRPGHGQLAPYSFIPIAELSNLIIQLDAWVLQRATTQAVEWQRRPGLEEFTVAVNISGRHLLSGQLVENVRQALVASSFPASRLVLEVTETVLITDLPTVAAYLEALRAAGIRIAIDDFGTGFTSLAALRALPVDVIKVDRSFVEAIDQAATRSLVDMVTQLGHELGVTIIAEGIETMAQRATLHEIGADQLQGFLISRPITAAALTETLNRVLA